MNETRKDIGDIINSSILPNGFTGAQMLEDFGFIAFDVEIGSKYCGHPGVTLVIHTAFYGAFKLRRIDDETVDISWDRGGMVAQWPIARAAYAILWLSMR